MTNIRNPNVRKLYKRVLQNQVAIADVGPGKNLKYSCIRGTVLYKPTFKTNDAYDDMKYVMTILCNAAESSNYGRSNIIDIWFHEKWKWILEKEWSLRKGNVIALWGDGIFVVNNSSKNDHKLDHKYRVLCGYTKANINSEILLLAWKSPTTMNRGYEMASVYVHGKNTHQHTIYSDSFFTLQEEESLVSNKKRKRCPNKYVYVETYEELAAHRKNDYVNMYAYIVGVSMPKPTRGRDLVMTINVLLPVNLEISNDTGVKETEGGNFNNFNSSSTTVIPTKTPAKRVTIKLFSPDIDNYKKLSIISKGNVIRIHRIKLDIWEGKYELVGNLNPRKRSGLSATIVYPNNELATISSTASEIDYELVNSIRSRSYVQSMVNGPKQCATINKLHFGNNVLNNSRFILFDVFEVRMNSIISNGMLRKTKFPLEKNIINQHVSDMKLILLVQDGTGMSNHGFYANAPKIDGSYDGIICPIVIREDYLGDYVVEKVKRLIRIVELTEECNNITTLGEFVWFKYFVIEMLDIKRDDNGYFIFNMDSSMIFLNKNDYNVQLIRSKLLPNIDATTITTMNHNDLQNSSNIPNNPGNTMMRTKPNNGEIISFNDTTEAIPPTATTNAGNNCNENIFNGLTRITWGENKIDGILCTKLGPTMDANAPFTKLKTILSIHGEASNRIAVADVYKTRVKIIFLFHHPTKFAKQIANSGRYEYEFLIKVEDEDGDHILVLVSGENASNFLPGIEPVNFNANPERLFQLENRLLDIMYTKPQAILDMYITLAKGQKVKMQGYEGQFFMLCDTYINVKKSWWRYTHK
jgi:hypothetical protein